MTRAGPKRSARRPPGAWNKRVPEDERAEDPAQLNVSQVEFLLDEAARDGDVHAVQVRDSGDQEYPADQQPANFASQKSFHG